MVESSFSYNSSAITKQFHLYPKSNSNLIFHNCLWGDEFQNVKTSVQYYVSWKKKLKIPFFVWGGKTHIWASWLSSRTRFQLLPWKSCNLSTRTYLLLTWIIWISIFSCNGPIMHIEHYNLIHIKNIINKPFSLLADFNCLANQLQLEWL